MVGSEEAVEQEVADEKSYSFSDVEEEYDLSDLYEDEPGTVTADAKVIDTSTGDENKGG